MLKKPCPIKENFARANHAPYMTEALPKLKWNTAMDIKPEFQKMSSLCLT